MYLERHWRMVRHSVPALGFIWALAGTHIASAAAISSLAGETPIPLISQTVDEWRNLSPPLLSRCAIDGCALISGVLGEMNTLARTSASALETSMKWQSSSFSIAGSRSWSKLIVFTSTSINLRLPLN
jgi:hypothetical protein